MKTNEINKEKYCKFASDKLKSLPAFKIKGGFGEVEVFINKVDFTFYSWGGIQADFKVKFKKINENSFRWRSKISYGKERNYKIKNELMYNMRNEVLIICKALGIRSTEVTNITEIKSKKKLVD
jgi:septum formation topological specificity factor MinE